MAESLFIDKTLSKAEIYEQLMPQIFSMMEGENNLIANLANIAAALHETFNHLWTGFYLLDEQSDTLVLGPFQGPIACTRIPLKPLARGVCGAAAESQETQVVPNVDEFQGHIACSSAAKSEIVVPLVLDGVTRLVLDVDSAELGTYDAVDQRYLEQLVEKIKEKV